MSRGERGDGEIREGGGERREGAGEEERREEEAEGEGEGEEERGREMAEESRCDGGEELRGEVNVGVEVMRGIGGGELRMGEDAPRERREGSAKGEGEATSEGEGGASGVVGEGGELIEGAEGEGARRDREGSEGEEGEGGDSFSMEVYDPEGVRRDKEGSGERVRGGRKRDWRTDMETGGGVGVCSEEYPWTI